MGQVTGIIVVLLLIIFVFVPLAILDANHLDTVDVKQSISLSARVLSCALEKNEKNMGKVADGYELGYEDGIEIDKEQLMTDFYQALSLNLPSQERFYDVRQKLCAKVLVYGDRFYVAGAENREDADRWSPPCFFTVRSGIYGDLYLGIQSPKAYYYLDGKKSYLSLEVLGISSEERNDAILEKLNSIVARYTKDLGVRSGLAIQIRNPAEQDVSERARNAYFNVLEGTTFFIVFAEDKLLNIYSKSFHYKNYSVTGYTVYP